MSQPDNPLAAAMDEAFLWDLARGPLVNAVEHGRLALAAIRRGDQGAAQVHRGAVLCAAVRAGLVVRWYACLGVRLPSQLRPELAPVAESCHQLATARGDADVGAASELVWERIRNFLETSDPAA